MTNEDRIALERRIAKLTAETLIAAGFTVTVNDGEELVLKNSTDVEAILDAMFSTDEDYLLTYLNQTETHHGWVRFIYGNDGYDVINDYTTNLEEVLAPVNAEIEKIEEEIFG